MRVSVCCHTEITWFCPRSRIAFAIIVANGISVICNKDAWVVFFHRPERASLFRRHSAVRSSVPIFMCVFEFRCLFYDVRSISCQILDGNVYLFGTAQLYPWQIISDKHPNANEQLIFYTFTFIALVLSQIVCACLFSVQTDGLACASAADASLRTFCAE